MSEKAKVPDSKVTDARFQLAEQVRENWRAHPEAGTTKDEILNPSYWSLVSRKLRPGAKIEVMAEDGTFYGELVVLACDRMWAKVQPVFWVTLTTADVSVSQAQEPVKPDYTYRYMGVHKKHCIIRTSDSAIVHEGAQTKDDALDWLKGHLKALTV